MNIDHVAIPTHDIKASVQWYVDRSQATVLYQDDSWAMLRIGQCKLALVMPQEHPPHVAFEVTEEELLSVSRREAVQIQTHRDGSKGLYIRDPFGNAVELICYPPAPDMP